MKKLFSVLFLLLTLPLSSSSFEDFEALVYGSSDVKNQGFFEDLYFYKRVYDKQLPALFAGNEEVDRIPKVIHFIWFGPKPYPEQSKENVKSWVAYHPDWTVKFWSDSSMTEPPVEGVEHHHFEEVQMQNRDLFDQSQNPGEKSDILRYEILFQEGGVYVDHDIEALRTFDAFNGSYDLYAFLETPHINPVARVFFFSSNGLIGAIPGHPILGSTIQRVRQQWAQAKKDFVGVSSENSYHIVMYRTFLSFVLTVREQLDNPEYDNICFPVCCWSKKALTPDIDSEVCFCHHDFSGSWIPDTPATKKQKKSKKKRK